jgi:diguanylate cyclase (GGDEF)-like protein/PAS domain S-box-containing protein
MKAALFSLSLRTRLLLAGTLVQVVMLALLIANGISVMGNKLNERASAHLAGQKQLLKSVLGAHLNQGDIAGVQKLLDGIRRDDGIVYLVFLDPQDRITASSGWKTGQPLPPVEMSFRQQNGSLESRFDTELDIDAAGKKLGKLRFGLSTAFMQTAHDKLVRDSLLIGGIALVFSVLLMIALSYWLTRSLTQLTNASASLAAGDLSVRLPITGGDEVSRLTHAFNAMAAALQSRIKALAENEAKFTAIADYSYDCELWISPEGALIWINPRVFDMFGYTPEECIGTANFPAPFISEPDISRTVREIRRALRGKGGQDYEFRARRKDGSEFWAAADWRPVYDSRGGYIGIRISIRDITQRKEAELRFESTVSELREAHQVQQEYLTRAQDEHARLSALLGAMDAGILFVSHDNKVVYSNPAFTRIWKIAPGTRLIGRNPQDVLSASPCTLGRPEEQSRHILRHPREGEIQGSFEIQLSDGRVITQQSHAVEDVYGHPVGHLWLFEDVTHAHQTADQLIYLAERDALTGLYNRHRFNEELARLTADVARQSSRVALLFFDLDDFKYINDTFGHRAGDAMLIRVAGEVGGQVRRNEIFARLGGDEFAILVPDISDEMLRVLADRITRSIESVRFQFEGQNLRLTSSLGIAIFPDHADNAEDLIARADTAMYQAKDAGKNNWRIYRSDLDTSSQLRARLSWNDRILHALENNLMDLQFQGIYSTTDRSLSHFEVLARMRDMDDTSTFLMPGQFIPMAE